MNKFFIYIIGLASIIFPWFALFFLEMAGGALRGLGSDDITIRGWIIIGFLPVVCLGIQLLYLHKNILRIPIIMNLTLTLGLVLITVSASLAGR